MFDSIECVWQVSKAAVVALSKASTASCGAKAAACAELAKLAEQQKKGPAFGTAAGVCLPFGCMEAAIQVYFKCCHTEEYRTSLHKVFFGKCASFDKQEATG